MTNEDELMWKVLYYYIMLVIFIVIPALFVIGHHIKWFG